MGMWKKISKLQKEVMRTPGPIRVQLLLLLTLTGSSVLSTGLLISNRVNNTSEENISGRNESLEVANEELRLKVTGKATTEVLTNLNKILNEMSKEISEERSSQYIPPQVESIMKRLDSSSQEEF